MKTVLAGAAAAILLSAQTGVQAQTGGQLGTINFPTSASAAAQPSFLTGVKALFNFEFDIAGDAFLDTQKADPSFALGYWGEAMSYNHPLWAQQDLAKARKAMDKLAETAAARSAKAPAGKERMLVESLDVLFGGSGDKLTRDIAYADAMKRIHEKFPADDEVTTFYALALLGTARPGDKSIRNAMQAAALSEAVFQRNPQHPGAAHYIIHSFDDPDHAILALPAARAVLEDRAGCGARTPHAVAHLRAAGHVGRRDCLEHRRVQGGGRAGRREESSARPRGLSHLVVAPVPAICSPASSTRRRRRWRPRRPWPTKTSAHRFVMGMPR